MPKNVYEYDHDPSKKDQPIRLGELDLLIESRAKSLKNRKQILHLLKRVVIVYEQHEQQIEHLEKQVNHLQDMQQPGLSTDPREAIKYLTDQELIGLARGPLENAKRRHERQVRAMGYLLKNLKNELAAYSQDRRLPPEVATDLAASAKALADTLDEYQNLGTDPPPQQTPPPPAPAPPQSPVPQPTGGLFPTTTN